MIETFTLEDVEKSIDPAQLVWIDAGMELRNPPKGIKIDLWPQFNQLTGGLRMREFSIVCGPTGAGKTAFLAALSSALVAQQEKHFVASVETGQVDFLLRVASCLLNENINTGEPTSEQAVEDIQERLSFAFGSRAKNCLYLSNIDNRMSVEFLCEKLKHAYSLGCRVAILDNLNFFLEVSSNDNAVHEMDRVVHEVIMLCKKIEMHVVMVMHPKKTDNGRVESEFDIKGSSTAVQEAQNIFLFNRMRKKNEDDDKYSPFYRELKAVKLRRRGHSVGKSILFDGSTPAYKEVGKQTQLKFGNI